MWNVPPASVNKTSVTCFQLKGEELWLSTVEFPGSESSVNLDVSNDDGVRVADLSYAERHIQVLSKELLPCKEDYPENGFIDCCKNTVWSKLIHSVNCSIASFDQISENKPALKECENPEIAKEAQEMYYNLMTKLAKEPHLNGCPLPCKRVTYDLDVTYYHENIRGPTPTTDKIEANFTLYFFTRFALIEEQVENLVYDIGGFLAAAGGNLGLLLGFSCLSVIFAMLNWLRKLV